MCVKKEGKKEAASEEKMRKYFFRADTPGSAPMLSHHFRKKSTMPFDTDLEFLVVVAH